ncbi:hypothetical protein FS749_002539 [Ceratobasidium sp. UAMH 11750]|nr:hypothetical protein FS749_002539 [Ceratobasidium sp. UAMH 11750]
MSTKIETEETKEPHVEKPVLRYAYVLIVPNPFGTGSFGIRRDPALAGQDELGQYYFWIKVGDSDNPEDRVDDYKNQNQGFVYLKFEDAEPNPGKKLETAVLGNKLRGGLAPGSKTEWRALYVRDREAAFELGKRLSNFLEEISSTEGLLQYNGVLRSLTTAVEGTIDVAGDTGGYIKHPRISIVVQPGVRTGAINFGFAWDETFDKGKTHAEVKEDEIFYAFQISIALSNTRHARVFDYVAETYKDFCPDISYNAFSVAELDLKGRKKKLEDVCKELKQTFGDSITSEPDPKGKSVWFDLSLKNNKNLKGNVLVLQNFVREFDLR